MQERHCIFHGGSYRTTVVLFYLGIALSDIHRTTVVLFDLGVVPDRTRRTLSSRMILGSSLSRVCP